MQSWLDTEPAQRDIEAGALMVLRLNHNKHMYGMALKAPHRMADKIEYELRKYLRIRLDGLTAAEVGEMTKTVVPASFKTAEAMQARLTEDAATGIAAGKRKDHDSLPENIRALWDKNRELYQKLKYVHEKLKSMECSEPCDRYEDLKILKDLDVHIRRNMAEYDGYQPKSDGGAAKPVETEPAVSDDPAALSRKIQAARTYISDNKAKLQLLQVSGDEEALSALIKKVEQRVSFLVSVGSAPAEDTLQELADLGVNV